MVEQIEVGLVSKVIGFVTRTPAELIKRRITANTMDFAGLRRNSDGDYELVRTNEVVSAKPVGELRQVSFTILHHIEYGGIFGEMTDSRYLEEGFDANAFYIDRDSPEKGAQRYQPMKIPNDVHQRYFATTGSFGVFFREIWLQNH